MPPFLKGVEAVCRLLAGAMLAAGGLAAMFGWDVSVRDLVGAGVAGIGLLVISSADGGSDRE